MVIGRSMRDLAFARARDDAVVPRGHYGKHNVSYGNLPQVLQQKAPVSVNNPAC